MPEQTLTHWGVKGMKWGVRKTQESGSSASGKKKMSWKERSRARAAAAVQKSGGSKGKAIAKQVVKTHLTMAAVNVGARVAMAILNRPRYMNVNGRAVRDVTHSVAKSRVSDVVKVATVGANIVTQITGIKRTVDIARSSQQDKNKN